MYHKDILQLIYLNNSSSHFDKKVLKKLRSEDFNLD